MDNDHRIVLRLEVDRDAEPISGTLTAEGEEGHPFTGWLGLTDAIEEIRGEAVRRPPENPEGP